jgi:hypothetical protein
MALMQRYETRLQNMYSRAIRTFKVLRTIELPDLDDDIPGQDHPPNIELPKEPSPIPEHPAPVTPDAAQPTQPSPQSADPEALGSACFNVRGSSTKVFIPSFAHAAVAGNTPVSPPPDAKESGAAV